MTSGSGVPAGRYLPAVVEHDLDVEALTLLLTLADRPADDDLDPETLAPLARRGLVEGSALTARGRAVAARLVPRPVPAPPPPPAPVGVHPATLALPHDAPLRLEREAASHLVVAAGRAPGAARLITAWARAGGTAPLTLVHDGGLDGGVRALAGDEPAAPGALEDALTARLARARVGVRVYLAGDEPVVRRCAVAARAAGVLRGELQTEPEGPERRVRCVACRAITDGVTGRRTTCATCGLPLRVRDHFSPRHGAYLGFPDGLEARSIGDHG